jgi:hypothetical protein
MIIWFFIKHLFGGEVKEEYCGISEDFPIITIGRTVLPPRRAQGKKYLEERGTVCYLRRKKRKRDVQPSKKRNTAAGAIPHRSILPVYLADLQ